MGEKILLPKNSFCAMSIGLLLTLVVSVEAADFRDTLTVRAFHAYEASIDTVLLRRLKGARYTHLIGEFQLGQYVSNTSSPNQQNIFLSVHGFSTRLCSLFVLADRYDLRLVPKIQTGSRWSGHWGKINKEILFVEPTPSIPYVNRKAHELQSLFTPSFANNPEFDSTFLLVLRTVSQSFSTVAHRLEYNRIDYIHLGHDEPTTDLRRGIPAPGKCRAGAEWIYKNVKGHGGIRKTNLNGGGFGYTGTPNPNAVSQLMAHEITQRVKQVQSVPGLQQCRIMVYGDAWDPEHNGGIWGTQSILHYPFHREIKASIIVLPWMFNLRLHNGEAYNEKVAFGAFTSSGFDILPVFSIADPSSPEVDTITMQRIKRMGRNMKALFSVSGPGKAIGFMGTSWTSWKSANPHPGYQTIEYAAYWSGTAHPGSDLRNPGQQSTTLGEYLAERGEYPPISIPLSIFDTVQRSHSDSSLRKSD